MVFTILVDIDNLVLKSSSTLAFWRNGVQNLCRRRRFGAEIEPHAGGLELDIRSRSSFGAVGCRILVDVDDFTLKLGSTLAVWRNGASNPV